MTILVPNASTQQPIAISRLFTCQLQIQQNYQEEMTWNRNLKPFFFISIFHKRSIQVIKIAAIHINKVFVTLTQMYSQPDLYGS